MKQITVFTANLKGAALDWAVGKSEGALHYLDVVPVFYKPSTDWAQGGPIIEREKITIVQSKVWESLADSVRAVSYENRFDSSGSTPLIAAMRCYVASKLGDTVEIPEELL